MISPELAQFISSMPKEMLATGVTEVITKVNDFVIMLSNHPELVGLMGLGLSFVDEVIETIQLRREGGEDPRNMLGFLKDVAGGALREGLPIYLGTTLVNSSMGTEGLKSSFDYLLGMGLTVAGAVPDVVMPIVRDSTTAIVRGVFDVSSSVKARRPNNSFSESVIDEE